MDGRSGQHANRVGQHRGRMSVMLENLRSRTLGVLLLPALSLIALPASSTEIPSAQKQSDYESMSPQTRAIQDDDNVNPGMLWVLDGEERWGRKDGSSNLSCADCHTSESMRGVAARYPSFEVESKRPIDLQERINICRSRHQNATPFGFESREQLALSAFVAYQSRGVPIQITIERTPQSLF